MAKTLLTPKKIVSLPKGAKLASFAKFARSAGIKFKDSGSIVIFDKEDNPRVFAFDAYSLWDLLCTLDEKLETVLSPKEYVFNNPLGGLVDALENTMPVSPEVLTDIEEARAEFAS